MKKIFLLLIIITLLIAGFIAVRFVNTKPKITAISAANELISGFPEFPVFPGAIVISSNKASNATTDGKGYSASWEVKGTENVAGVLQWYKIELPKDGWTLINLPEEEQSQDEMFLKASKGDKTAVVIFETGENNENGVEVLVDIPVDKL